MNVNHFSSEKPSNYEELGIIVLNADGTISQSSGELENDDRTAQIFSSMIDCLQLYQSLNPTDGIFTNITVQYHDYSYSVLVSKKSTIIKRKLIPTNLIDP